MKRSASSSTIIDSKLQSGLKLSPKQQLWLGTLRKISEQQKYMYDNHTHSVPERIVSVSQPFIRCKLHGIRLSGPALGRTKKDEQRDRRQTYLDQNERIEVERQFSLAKRKCNLGKVKTRREEIVGFTLAMSIVVLNLRKIRSVLSRLLFQILRYLWQQQKLAFVQ